MIVNGTYKAASLLKQTINKLNKGCKIKNSLKGFVKKDKNPKPSDKSDERTPIKLANSSNKNAPKVHIPRLQCPAIQN
jgi:hypothetical protein